MQNSWKECQMLCLAMDYFPSMNHHAQNSSAHKIGFWPRHANYHPGHKARLLSRLPSPAAAPGQSTDAAPPQQSVWVPGRAPGCGVVERGVAHQQRHEGCLQSAHPGIWGPHLQSGVPGTEWSLSLSNKDQHHCAGISTNYQQFSPWWVPVSQSVWYVWWCGMCGHHPAAEDCHPWRWRWTSHYVRCTPANGRTKWKIGSATFSFHWHDHWHTYHPKTAGTCCCRTTTYYLYAFVAIATPQHLSSFVTCCHNNTSHYTNTLVAIATPVTTDTYAYCHNDIIHCMCLLPQQHNFCCLFMLPQ